MVIAFEPGRHPALASPAEVALLLAGASTETTPRQADRIVDFAELLPRGSRVNVTFLVGSDFEETIRTARRLKPDGMVPVPHLAARLIRGPRVLDEMLARLQGEVGVDEVLVIAGGCKLPAGEFDNSMQLLESGLLERHGIRRIGVAGHPEGSPDIAPLAAMDSVIWKNGFAERTGAEMYIATQFCFDAEAVIRWEREIRAAGNRLAIHVGLAGPATPKTLLGYATTCGIGPSLRMLTRQTRNLAKLAQVRTPDEMVQRLARHKANDPDCLIRAVHLFPLGGVAKTAHWLAETRAAVMAEGAGAAA